MTAWTISDIVPAMNRTVADWIYAALDLLLAGTYLLVFLHLAPSRTAGFTVLAVGLSGLLAAGGVATLLPGKGARRLAMAACGVMVAACVALITLLLMSAAYLHGIYDGIGQAGAAIAVLVAAVALEAVGLVPGLQLIHLWRKGKASRAEEPEPA